MPPEELKHVLGTNTNGLSFEQSLRRADGTKFSSWPHFSIEDEERYRKNHEDADKYSVKLAGASSTIDIVSSTRSPLAHQKPGFLRRCKLMCTRFPCRDMSYLVGVSFSIGSAVFTANAFFLLLPLVAPETNFPEEMAATVATGVTGALIFTVGSSLAVLEALNLKRGTPLITEGVPMESSSNESVYEKKKDVEEVTVQEVKSGFSVNLEGQGSNSQGVNVAPALFGSSMFIYWPNFQELKTVYSRDLMFIASIIQLNGAMFFGMATITGLPNVISPERSDLIPLLILLPASIGGFSFTLAAITQLFSTQDRGCLIPELGKWDWWAAFYNTFGALGFFLSGFLPLIGKEVIWGTMADFLGSWAFLIGSLIQWWGVMGEY